MQLLLLYGDRRWHCTLSSNNSTPIRSTSDVPMNRRNIHHRPALLWHFSWLWHRIQNCRLTHLLTQSNALVRITKLKTDKRKHKQNYNPSSKCARKTKVHFCKSLLSVTLTCCWSVFKNMVVADWSNASGKHNRFDPLPTFTGSWQLQTERPCKSGDDRLSELVAVIRRTIAGFNGYSEWTRQVWRILSTRIFPRKNITYKWDETTI